MHDYDHLGGKAKSDRENIERAVIGLRTQCLVIDRPYLGEIEDIMWATEYPHLGDDREPLVQQIIQDADLSQTFDPAWYTIVIHGLGGELKKTPLDMLKLQPTFIGNTVFKTEWAEQLFPLVVRQAKIAEAKDFITCYETP
jgi:hypothetical protein